MSTGASPASDTILDPAAAPLEAPVVDVILDAKPAEPSAAEALPDAKIEPPSLGDIVRDVVKKAEPDATAPSAVEASQEAPADGTPPAEGDTDVPFHEHPRWKQRTEELKALKVERDEALPDAKNYRAITEYMREASLSPAEVAEGFEVMGLLKAGDPASLAKARDWLHDRVQALDLTLGHILPPDLQTQVDGGLVTEDIARQLARSRANEAHLSQRRDADTTRQTEQRQANDVAQRQTQIASAVTDWEAGVKAKDPDYAKKVQLVEAQSRAIVQRTGRPPQTAAEGVQLVEAAYAEVNELLKPMAPAKRAITPAPTSLSARAIAQPKTLREAIALSLNR